MIERRRTLILGAAAMMAGLGIAFVDSRPTWDDAGISAGLLILAGAAFGLLGGRRPWLWGLLVGIWIPILELGGPAGAASLIALVFAAVGAACGYTLARWRALDPRVHDET